MNKTLDLINSHVSIRKYADKPIESELLKTLVNAAARASNTGNMQTYSIIATTDNATKKQLAPAHFNQKMITEAPLVLTFCADFHLFDKWCAMRNADAGFNNFESFVGAAIDAALAAQNFAVAAESEGLGICFLGTTTYNAQEIIETLKLPPLVMPVTTITVGYPAESPAIVDRLPIEAILHNETYAEQSESAIDGFFREKENNETYKKYIVENGKETLAQVFTDIRYTRANNEFFSQKYLDALKQQGFFTA